MAATKRSEAQAEIRHHVQIMGQHLESLMDLAQADCDDDSNFIQKLIHLQSAVESFLTMTS